MTRASRVARGLASGAALCAALLQASETRAASLVATSTTAFGLESASRFYVHWANQRYWIAFHNATTPVLFSSPDGLSWTSQGAIFSSFNPPVNQGEWAVDSGLAWLGYVSHGGAAVWASENIWNSWDAASLRAQSRQPLLLTMNCLNGYFVAPAFDSLAESLVKPEGKGAIAAFSPSGLSLDGPAHQYHRALMAEITSGRHARLGDALLAAQADYAQSGLTPELLEVYHLFGDPAMAIR